MLLKSSSTPVLGSLLSSLSDTPPNPSHNETPIHHSQHKPLFHSSGSLNLCSFSANSSPISPSIAEFSSFDRQSSNGGFRRVQSEGNLAGLPFNSCDGCDGIGVPKPPPKVSRKPCYTILETIPSFSFKVAKGRCKDEEEESDEGEEVRNSAGLLEKGKMSLVEEKKFVNVGFGLETEQVSPQMYLARGLGVIGGSYGGGCGGGSGGGDFNRREFGGDGGDGGRDGTEEYYKKMVEENPGNPLILRNYAQFLHHSKQDLRRAEEYYSRAILADPKDGETLSQYAKLVWELHRDHDRALSYFERAARAAPEDSHVHAAFASFLWETEEDEDEDTALKDGGTVPPLYYQGPMVSATASY